MSNPIHLSSIPIELSPDDKLPTRVRLFKTGENITSKGIFVYDPKNIPEIKANQINKDGRDLYPIDVAHLSLTSAPNPDAHISVGWFELSFEEDGIWAENIEWTERGKSYLQNREFRFISPAFDTRQSEASGEEIIYISNFAITNNPATYNPLPLVASKETKEFETMSEEQRKEETNSVTLEEDKKEENKEELEDGSEQKTEEEETLEDPAVDELSPEEKDKLIEDLKAQLSAVQDELMAAKEELAEYKAKEEDMEKDEALSKVSLSDSEKQFFKKLSLDQIKEYVELRKDSSVSSVKLSKDSEVASDKKEPEHLKAPKLSTQVLSKQKVSIPSQEEIEKIAQRLANQRIR